MDDASAGEVQTPATRRRRAKEVQFPIARFFHEAYSAGKDMPQYPPLPNIWSLVGFFVVKAWPFLVLDIVLLLVIRLTDPESMRYFFRRNYIELLTAFFAVAGYGVNYYLVQQPERSFFINVTITFIAMLVFIYSKTRERDFYFMTLRRTKDKQDWIGDGTFQYERTQNAYVVTNARAGVIFPKCLIWSDYKLNFEFKILKTSLGVIVRATNLSNLVTLQIKETGIKAGIRVNGFEQSWEPKDANLEFEKELNPDKWYVGSIKCDKGSIGIRIFEWIELPDPKDPSETRREEKMIFDRVWKIPSGNIDYNVGDGLVWEIMKGIIRFPINLDYGTFGFFNDGVDNALVKDVLIEKL
jgi:hypothetical protein